MSEPWFRQLYARVSNVCRLMLAEEITRRMLAARLGSDQRWLEVGSAGVEAIPRQPTYPYVRELLHRHRDGFASRRLTADLVVAPILDVLCPEPAACARARP